MLNMVEPGGWAVFYALLASSQGPHLKWSFVESIKDCHKSSKHILLVGGLEHEFYFSIYWECHHPNWRTHIFQRGRYTTNQTIVASRFEFQDQQVKLIFQRKLHRVSMSCL
jgi:hypothetical protein